MSAAMGSRIRRGNCDRARGGRPSGSLDQACRSTPARPSDRSSTSRQRWRQWRPNAMPASAIRAAPRTRADRCPASPWSAARSAHVAGQRKPSTMVERQQQVDVAAPDLEEREGQQRARTAPARSAPGATPISMAVQSRQELLPGQARTGDSTWMERRRIEVGAVGARSVAVRRHGRMAATSTPARPGRQPMLPESKCPAPTTDGARINPAATPPITISARRTDLCS